MSGERLGARQRESDHQAAVANTLHWAEQAAGRGEFGEALEWLRMLEVMGDELPDAYRQRRTTWIAARSAARERAGSAFGQDAGGSARGC